ncbi:IPT/TIG domain-containing protein [Streptomyces sp. NPDC101132]|uniref:IPT/TIG domain-containing protein n=1 Tax=Streptomyces sp. NPDC101132 TaxID=3366110 RepID=UPI0037F55A27
MAALRPFQGTGSGAEVIVVDASGTQFCDFSKLNNGTCLLSGTGPFRALVSPTHAEARAYLIDFYRTDGPDCPAIPAGDFTSGTASAHFSTGSGVFSHCFTIPAGDHTRAEHVQLRALAGDERAMFSVVGPDGKEVCAAGGYLPSGVGCTLTPGSTYVVLAYGSDISATYSLTRRDVTASAKGCTSTAAGPVGGASKGGTLAAPGLYKCRQVTTTDARDVVHINVRDPLGNANMYVISEDGTYLPCHRNRSCAVTGSTRYQVVIYVPYWLKAAATYRFDAQRIATAAGPAPECPEVNVAYGYGPLAGTLDEQHTAVCRALIAKSSDGFELRVDKDAAGARTALAALYGQGLEDRCMHYGDGTSQCSAGSAFPAVPVTGLLVLGLPDGKASSAFRAELACTFAPCGTDEFDISSITPATGVTGTKATVTVKGTALHEDDKVRLTHDGKEITSTAVSVSADRRTLKAVLDLTGAKTGAWGMTFEAHRGTDYLMGHYTVTSSPLKNTTAPTISGTARVGAKLTASRGSWTPVPDSYTYQWKADGVAIEGATGASLVVPAAALGKKVTVTVRAHSAKYGSRSATSAATAAVGKGVAPKATTAPSVGGTAKVGRTLTAARGTWTPAPTSYRYQWYADGTAIDGATGTTLVLRSAQRGKRITVKVTALRTGHHSGTAVSAPTAVVVA